MLIPLLYFQIRSSFDPATPAARRNVRNAAATHAPAPRTDLVQFGGNSPGPRYQTFRALREMARGNYMIVQKTLPVAAVDQESAAKCRAFLSALRDTANWRDSQELTAIFVPGTLFPGVVGQIMIRSGWCEPFDHPHWVPNLRLFVLTDLGREALENAWNWWRSLRTSERLRLILME